MTQIATDGKNGELQGAIVNGEFGWSNNALEQTDRPCHAPGLRQGRAKSARCSTLALSHIGVREVSMVKLTANENQSTGYLLFVLLVSVLGLLLLAATVLLKVDPAVATIIEYADTAVCVLFFLDFLVTLIRTRNRKRYLITWGWLDLISSVPMLPALRVGRIVRIVRVVRVLRGIRSLRVLASFVLERRAQSAIMAAAFMSILLLLFGSIAILQFEHGPGANINGPQDALWWSVVTLTTVGYGDRYPVTTEGRFVAAFLMVAGMGLFGALSGFVAAWFLSPGEKEQENEVAALRREIRELREVLKGGG